jgi:hypothetical protein
LGGVMDPAAILALIADLYTQVHEATARAQRAEQELARRDAAEGG